MIKNLIVQNQLRPADVIVAKKKKGLGRILNHYLGDGLFSGNLREGVKEISHNELTKMLRDFEPTEIRRFRGEVYERNNALIRAVSVFGEKYNLATFNCEHYANWVQKGRVNSKQVTIALILIAGISYKFFNNNNNKR